MTSVEQVPEPEKQYFNIQLDACPQQLLKSVENIKKMGLNSVHLQLEFNTIQETELFTHILNREQQQEKVANQLKTTYFHNVRGKIKKVELTKNQEFNSMKKMKFNSSYHVVTFLKYFNHRICQIQNEYKYILTSGNDGYLNIYINQGQISRMFLNQIRDMKRRLQFWQIKFPQTCQKFIYSQQLGQRLKKQQIYYQIWYKGKQSTIIFYSQKHVLNKIKSVIDIVTKYHMTIIKMIDYKIPFLVNYLLFKVFVMSFKEEIRWFRSVDQEQIQFNQNKLGIIVHDYHEVFTEEILQEVGQVSKKLILMSFKGRNARSFYNTLKKEFQLEKYIQFNYSKKHVSICINKQKIDSYQKIKRMFRIFNQSIDQMSQITFYWFHLKQKMYQEFRQNLVKNFALLTMGTNFYIENFENFYENKDYRCVLRYKNFSLARQKIGEQIGEVLANFVKLWGKQQQSQAIKKPNRLGDKIQKQLIFSSDNKNQEKQENQSDSGEQSQYQLEQQTQTQKLNLATQEPKTRQIEQPILNQINEKITQTFEKLYEKLFANFDIDENKLWKQSKSLNSLQQVYEEKADIMAKIKLVTIHQKIKQELRTMELNRSQQDNLMHLNILGKSKENEEENSEAKLKIIQKVYYCDVLHMPNDLKWKDGIENSLLSNLEGLQDEKNYLACQVIEKAWILPLFIMKVNHLQKSKSEPIQCKTVYHTLK